MNQKQFTLKFCSLLSTVAKIGGEDEPDRLIAEAEEYAVGGNRAREGEERHRDQDADAHGRGADDEREYGGDEDGQQLPLWSGESRQRQEIEERAGGKDGGPADERRSHVEFHQAVHHISNGPKAFAPLQRRC